MNVAQWHFSCDCRVSRVPCSVACEVLHPAAEALRSEAFQVAEMVLGPQILRRR